MITSAQTLRSARSRSRRRRHSAGAAMFIVTVTLALLAMMGVYGLTATSNDIKSSAHVRQRAQAAHAAEYAVTMVTEACSNTGTAQTIVEEWLNKQPPPPAKACFSTKPYGGLLPIPQDEKCFSVTIDPNEAKELFRNPDLSIQWAPGATHFSTESIGSQLIGVRSPLLQPFFRVEFSNPIPITKQGTNQEFTQLTVSIYVWIGTPTGTVGVPGAPYDEIFKGKGFISVPRLKK